MHAGLPHLAVSATTSKARLTRPTGWASIKRDGARGVASGRQRRRVDLRLGQDDDRGRTAARGHEHPPDRFRGALGQDLHGDARLLERRHIRGDDLEQSRKALAGNDAPQRLNPAAESGAEDDVAQLQRPRRAKADGQRRVDHAGAAIRRCRGNADPIAPGRKLKRCGQNALANFIGGLLPSIGDYLVAIEHGEGPVRDRRTEFSREQHAE